jgi:lipoate-protein ligase A
MADQPAGGNTRARLIDVGSVPPLTAQATCHGIADAMQADDPPAVVLAGPESGFVSVGACQDVMREIDVQACISLKVPLIRRETGGPALWLSADDLLVHVVLPRSRPEARSGVSGLYARFAEPFVATWNAFGLQAERGAWGGIMLDRYRVGGIQAGLVRDVVIVGGSLLVTFDADLLARRASLPSEQLREQIHETVREAVSRAQRPPTRQGVREVMLDRMASALDWTLEPSPLRDDELAAISRRELQMADEEHIFQGGRRMARAELRATGGVTMADLTYRGAGGQIRLRLLERSGAIAEIEITGDLTCLPSDGLERLAPRLVGLRRDAPDLAARIHGQMGLLGVELAGITAAELAIALRPPPPAPDPMAQLLRLARP